MLDSKFIRANAEAVRQAIANKGVDASVDTFLQLDERRRLILAEVEQLKNQRNTASLQVAELKKAKQDATSLIAETRTIGQRIKELDEELRDVEARLQDELLSFPNIPHESVPIGPDESGNVFVRSFSEPTKFGFTPLPHWDLATNLDIIDWERGVKVTGARFIAYKGLGARLHRSVINFMLDVHTSQHGYREVSPPYIVNRTSMTGTGQLPKFEDDAFKLADTDYFLNPTAEVPVTNLHRDEILDAEQLPLYYVAYCPSFRREAGSAGRDTRGVIRMHQFHKVELVKFTRPEDSYAEMEKLLGDAEHILQLLGLPYRVMKMCTGDLGFTAAMKYDPEVWMPSYDRYVEISSVSNFEDFQARRVNVRYRPEPKARPEFVHTMNGSGLAIDRTIAAILENYQTAEGDVIVPEVLRPYMGVDRISRVTK
ncbi:MAG TPA: serine--tRNA ligase [Firmicutes bacterium]|nr:serine--tRNA ligase [Bacillota bacterium]